MLLVSLVILSTLLTTASTDWTDCSLPCRCKWISGKKTALCSSSGLTALPNISSETQVLDIQNNFITYLKSEAFYSIELINLQKIFMRNTSLTVLHRDAFSNLKILIEVDLSDNQLALVPQGAFSGNDRLKVLVLNGNPIKELSAEQFPPLPHLRSLEIENCKLQSIHKNAFINLHQLERLSLRNNTLKTLSDAAFKPLIKLKSLALENNPWKCDCKLRSLRNWFLSSKLHSVSLACTEPEWLKHKLWEEVEPHEFACPPNVKVDAKMIQRDIGENVTFACLAKGDPEPNVTWYFNGHPVDGQNATGIDQLLIIEMDEGLLEKWINVTLVNLTDSNAGEYSCVAKNPMGSASHNVSLVLPQVVTATTLSKADMYSPVVGLVCGGIATAVSCIVIGLACGYRKRRRLTAMQKGRLKKKKSRGQVDQEKKLLDISITSATSTTTANTTTAAEQSSSGMLGWGVDIMRGSDSESRLIESPLELCEPIYKEQSVMIPIAAATSAYPMYPPPPAEFASMTPSGFGNIFISVSVSQDPYSDIQRYPDLLDIPYKGASPTTTTQASNVSYATLPRQRQIRTDQTVALPANDKLGPRVTVEGSSILYHHAHHIHHHHHHAPALLHCIEGGKDAQAAPSPTPSQQQQQQQQQALAPLPPQAAAFVTEYVSL